METLFLRHLLGTLKENNETAKRNRRKQEAAPAGSNRELRLGVVVDAFSPLLLQGLSFCPMWTPTTTHAGLVWAVGWLEYQQRQVELEGSVVFVGRC